MEKLKQILTFLNTQGLPLPLVRYEGKPNMSATVFALATAIVIFGFLVNFGVFAWATYTRDASFKPYDMTNCLAFFGTCAVPYIFRSKGNKDDSNS